MAISVETLAAAKKYADKVAGSGGGGSAVVADGSITEAKLSSDVKASINKATEHTDDKVSEASGAHGLRYYNGALQYNNNGTWVTLSIADLLI